VLCVMRLPSSLKKFVPIIIIVIINIRVRPNFVFFYFSAPENAVFYFSAKKDIRIFVYFLFSVLKWPLKKQKKKVSTLAEAMHGG